MQVHYRNGFLGLFLAFVMLGMGGCFVYIDGCAAKAKFEKVINLSQPLVAGSHLNATTPCGSIKAQGSETSTCSAQVTIRTRACSEAEAQELAEQIQVQLLPTTEGLELKAEYPKRQRGQSFSINYVITLPQQSNFSCKSSSGSIDLENLQGTIRANTSSGSIHTRQLGQGDVHCQTSSGSVSLTNGQGIGNCELRTSSGSVKASQVQAQSLYLKTSSGSVTADQVTCPKIVGRTSSGGVRAFFTADTPADLDADLSTSSGSVKVTLPPIFGGGGRGGFGRRFHRL